MSDDNTPTEENKSKRSRGISFRIGAFGDIAEDTFGALSHAVTSIGKEMMHQIAPGAVSKPGHFEPRSHVEGNEAEDQLRRESVPQLHQDKDEKDGSTTGEPVYRALPLTESMIKKQYIDRTLEPNLDQLKQEKPIDLHHRHQYPRNNNKESVSDWMISTEKRQKGTKRSLIGQMFFLVFWAFQLVFRLFIAISRIGFSKGRRIYRLIIDTIEARIWKTDNILPVISETDVQMGDNQREGMHSEHAEPMKAGNQEITEEETAKAIDLEEQGSGAEEGVIFDASRERESDSS